MTRSSLNSAEYRAVVVNPTNTEISVHVLPPCTCVSVSPDSFRLSPYRQKDITLTIDPTELPGFAPSEPQVDLRAPIALQCRLGKAQLIQSTFELTGRFNNPLVASHDVLDLQVDLRSLESQELPVEVGSLELFSQQKISFSDIEVFRLSSSLSWGTGFSDAFDFDIVQSNYSVGIRLLLKDLLPHGEYEGMLGVSCIVDGRIERASVPLSIKAIGHCKATPSRVVVPHWRTDEDKRHTICISSSYNGVLRIDSIRHSDGIVVNDTSPSRTSTDGMTDDSNAMSFSMKLPPKGSARQSTDEWIRISLVADGEEYSEEVFVPVIIGPQTE